MFILNINPVDKTIVLFYRVYFSTFVLFDVGQLTLKYVYENESFLMFVLLFLCSMGTKAQDLGANYNENIDYPITEIEMLKQSKVTWVRGFVNIPNLFLQNENRKIVGVKENAIRTHIPTLKFIQAKKALGDRVKFILSLKIPFELYTDTVPKVGTKEMEYIFQATEVLLKTYDMAKNIEILVMGNEPEWEECIGYRSLSCGR